jgi:cyclophilin family peptidyl-prolyl cis-trans isomerase
LDEHPGFQKEEAMGRFKWVGLFVAGVFVMGCAVPSAAQTTGEKTKAGAAKVEQKMKSAGPIVVMETSLGEIRIELNPEKAPVTVANFLSYVRQGFYDGLIFHRVIKGFMIQGGGFTADMVQKKTGDPIKNEAGNGLKNLRGTIAMARTSVVNSATSQFFINVVDNAFLDHKDETDRGFGYCVFGKVTEGMDVVDKIRNVKTATKGMYQDVPAEPVTIVRAYVLGEENAKKMPAAPAEVKTKVKAQAEKIEPKK